MVNDILALVPLFDRVKGYFELERNNYDKSGHFAQGFVPAIIARELSIRKQEVNGNKWLGHPSDMGMALFGARCALVFLRRVHDKQ